MEFSDNVKAVTQNYLAPKVVDTVLGGNILTSRILGNAKKWRGRNLEKSIQVAKKTNGGSFAGLDTFNTNTENNKEKLSFDLRAYQEPVVLPGLEADVVASDQNASIDFITEAMEEASNSMLDGIGDIIYGDGTGNANKDFLGLRAIVDDGTLVSNYGGLSRSTYSSIQSNRFAPGTGLTTLDTLRTADDAARHGKDRVTLNITTEAIWSDFEALIQPTLSTNVMGDGYKQVTRTGIVANKAALKGEVGFDSLFFRGAPVVADEKCESLYWYGLNERFLGFYTLKSSDPQYKQVTVGNNKEIEGVYNGEGINNAGVFFSGLMNSINQYGRVGHFILSGNLVSFNPNRHFVIKFS